MSDKLTRKSIKHDIKHDKFAEELEGAYSFAKDHRVRVASIVLGVLALGLIGFTVYTYRARTELKAQLALSEAIAVIEAPVGDLNPAASPTAPKYKTEDEKVAKAEPMLSQVVKTFEGTDAADVARLYLARIAASRGDVATARVNLEKFLADHPDHILAGPAEMSLYELRLTSEAPKGVIADLETLLRNEESRLPKDAVLVMIARAWELAGDDAKAKESYQRLVNEYPESAYSLDAQRRLFRG